VSKPINQLLLLLLVLVLVLVLCVAAVVGCE